MGFAQMAGVLHIEGPDGASTVALPADTGPLTIGRGETARVRLKDDRKQISREHLLLQWGDGSGQLTVLGQLACTVRGEVLGTGSRTTLAAGDTIVVGDFRLVVRLPTDRAAERPWQDPPADNGRLNKFLATPASAPVAPTFTQWSHGGPRGSAPAASAPQAAPVPGLDGPPRRPADLLGQFIAPASERPPPEPAARADRSVAWTPADPPSTQPSAHLAPARGGQALGGAGTAAAADGPSADVPLAAPPEAGARPAASGVLGAWIQPAGVAPPMPHPAAGSERPGPGPAATPQATPQPLSGWGIEHGAAQQAPATPDPAPAQRQAAAAPACDAPSASGSSAGLAAPASEPAAQQAARCLAALADGLGIDALQAHAPEDWQRMGVTVRLLVDGLRLMLSDRKALRSELRVPDPTQFYYSDNNPLKTDLSLQELVGILMSSPQTSRTFMPFDNAVQEAVDDLRSHNLAIIAATRATVVGVIQEFDPQKLRASLPGASAKAGAAPEGAPSFLERGRLWKAYADRYDAMNANLADWIERVFDRHFIAAYSREAARQRSR